MGDPNDKLVADTLSLSDGTQHFFVPDSMRLYDILSVGDLLGLPNPNTPDVDQVTFIDQVHIELNTTPSGLVERLVGDRLNILDLDQERAPYSKALSDSYTLTDGITQSSGISSPLSDTLSITDATSQILSFFQSLSDTLAFSDAAADSLGGSGAHTASLSDILDLFDSIQVHLNPVGNYFFSDSLSLTDQVDVVLNSFGTSYLRRYLNDVLPS